MHNKGGGRDISTITTLTDVRSGWEWINHPGQKMINKVASTIQVDIRLQCMLNCTLSASC